MHEEIKRIEGESGLGIMFENIAHSQLTCSDIDFDAGQEKLEKCDTRCHFNEFQQTSVAFKKY
jgi:hypothetical protein